MLLGTRAMFAQHVPVEVLTPDRFQNIHNAFVTLLIFKYLCSRYMYFIKKRNKSLLWVSLNYAARCIMQIKLSVLEIFVMSLRHFSPFRRLLWRAMKPPYPTHTKIV